MTAVQPDVPAPSPPSAALPSAAQLAALTIVAQGDGYVVGSPHTSEYVEVPELGGRILEWLRAGQTLPECARTAASVAGEPVDVPDFLATLAGEGLFGDGAPEVPAAAVARLGRLLFHPVAWAGYALLAVTAVVLPATVPGLRPTYRDGFPFTTQLLNILTVTALATVAIAAHEGAHVLATAAHGLRSRLSVSRRLYFLTFQADLTRLWSVPRRARYGPLLAGMAADGAILAGALAAEAVLGPGGVLVRLLRAVVLLQFTAVLAQMMVFMRTDVYALLVNATGCTTLWATKGALLRKYLRRATDADAHQLATAGPREVTWARRYLWLYVPGVAAALVYLVGFALPSLPRLVELCVAPIRADGLRTAAAWEGLAALLVAVVPALWALSGAVRSGLRVAGGFARRRRDRR